MQNVTWEEEVSLHMVSVDIEDMEDIEDTEDIEVTEDMVGIEDMDTVHTVDTVYTIQIMYIHIATKQDVTTNDI